MLAPSINLNMPLPSFRNGAAQKEFLAQYRANQKLWPVPYEEKRIRTSFGVTNVMVSGSHENPPLLLLHGFMNTPLMWRYNIEALSARFRVYMPETLGDVGLSRCRQIALKPDHWSEWLLELFGRLDLSSIRLGGFSLGAWHAARFAIKHPEHVSSLVLISPVPFFRKVPYHILKEAMSVVLTEKRPEVRRLIGKQYAAQYYPDKPYERLQYSGITGFLPSLPIFPRELNSSEWNRLPRKTLILAGDEEIYYDPHEAQKQAEHYLQKESFFLFEETGHSVSIERPDLVNPLFLEFWGS